VAENGRSEIVSSLKMNVRRFDQSRKTVSSKTPKWPFSGFSLSDLLIRDSVVLLTQEVDYQKFD